MLNMTVKSGNKGAMQLRLYRVLHMALIFMMLKLSTYVAMINPVYFDLPVSLASSNIANLYLHLMSTL